MNPASACKRAMCACLSACVVDGEEEAEQPRKKLKLDTDRLKQIIATTSSHDWEVQEVGTCVQV